MSRPREKCRSSLCKACPDRARNCKLLTYQGLTFPVMRWSCKKKHVCYIIRCKLCETFKIYVGCTIEQINTRTRKHRFEVQDTSLDLHFSSLHPNDQMYGNIELFIASDIIDDEDSLRYEEWRIRHAILKEEKGLEIQHTCLINLKD